ncbi:MAG: hypothetical protein ACRERV_00020 [Methylococcales bacterium]
MQWQSQTRYSYCGYAGLFTDEFLTIVAYMELCDKKSLERIIRDPEGVKSQGMRDFVADIVTGKLKRKPRKKKSTIRRDIDITLDINELMFYDGLNLTSNRAANGAAVIVSERYGVTEDVALKSYIKYRKIVSP